MIALSILQPWAWLIVRPDITDPEERARAYLDGLIKDIENRTWSTRFRGTIFVHAGKKISKRQHDEDREYFAEFYDIVLPEFTDIPIGGIVGKVDITDCVLKSGSRWKQDGSFGFVLANAQPLPFTPYRGQLGFFPVDASVASALEGATG